MGAGRADLRALSTSDLPSGAHAYSLLSPNGLDGTSPGPSAPTSVASPTAVACAAGRSATNTRFMPPFLQVSQWRINIRSHTMTLALLFSHSSRFPFVSGDRKYAVEGKKCVVVVDSR